MRVFKVRVIALVALVVAALGVTVANANSQCRYYAFTNKACAGPAHLSGNSISCLKRLGFGSVIDAHNLRQGCIVI